MSKTRSNYDPAKIDKLVDKAQQGDQQAFAQIYKIFADPIYRFALIKLSDRDKAEDVVAETFRRLWRYLDRYRAKNFRSYIFTIARNIIIDIYKQESKENLARIEDCSWLEDDSEGIEVTLIKEERKQTLYKAVRKLPENYKQVITLRFIEELSIKETAVILKRTQVSVRVMQHRGLKKLRALLEGKIQS